jgi:hypothetical protein
MMHLLAPQQRVPMQMLTIQLLLGTTTIVILAVVSTTTTAVVVAARHVNAQSRN